MTSHSGKAVPPSKNHTSRDAGGAERQGDARREKTNRKTPKASVLAAQTLEPIPQSEFTLKEKAREDAPPSPSGPTNPTKKTVEPRKKAAPLALLRSAMLEEQLDAYLIPRTDIFQGEFVAPCDERLHWATGFSGSAGLALIGATQAALFVDGRYDLQAAQEVAGKEIDVQGIASEALGPWAQEKLAQGAVIGCDPWLLSVKNWKRLDATLRAQKMTLRPCADLIEALWEDRPAPPSGKAMPHPKCYSGRVASEKLASIQAALKEEGIAATVLTQPASVAWALNIRGDDLHYLPVVQAMAIIRADGPVTLFMDLEKVTDVLEAHLTSAVGIKSLEEFYDACFALTGPLAIDPETAPMALEWIFEGQNLRVIHQQDPTVMPRAQKNDVEIRGARAAHLKDAIAMVETLAWIDAEGRGKTELDVVARVEAARKEQKNYQGAAFATIAGAGANGAIVHYHPTKARHAVLEEGALLLLDSGGQYLEGTTDVTRTIAIGQPSLMPRHDYTLVLKGMIAVSMARWPKERAANELDARARHALWSEGKDYAHGTGHGVGSYLDVHEGPARISGQYHKPLHRGMILSNEPGFYRAGAYGIRIENLVLVQEETVLPSQQKCLSFETLTHVPLDRKLIMSSLLTPDERAWVDHYHAQILSRLGPLLTDELRSWLEKACAPLEDEPEA